MLGEWARFGVCIALSAALIAIAVGALQQSMFTGGILAVYHLCVICVSYNPMNANELRRWIEGWSGAFHTHKGGSGHVTVRLGDMTTQLPMHGNRRELGRGLVAKIKKDLGLD